MTKEPYELSWNQLKNSCMPENFEFHTTAELEP